MTSLESDPTPQLAAAGVRTRLELLAALGCAFLESGQTSGRTRRALRACGLALGLVDPVVNSFGRVLLIETVLPDGSAVTLSGAARTLDTIDCDRSRALNHVAASLTTPSLGGMDRRHLVEVRADIQRMREASTPWWVTSIGMTMLAFFISMQVGISWRAWISAAVVQVVTSLTGVGVGRIRMPKLFAIVFQSAVGGAFATLLVQLGFVDPVGAAAAIAVTWLLLLPLPQIIGAVTDAIEGDYLSSLTRVAGVAVSGIGIFIGGAFTFWLGEQLSMAHPKLDALPSLPWYLVLIFSGLGATANAFANGGRQSLVLPAALLGLITGATDQVLLRVLDAPTLWASSASAVVLGILVVILAERTGYLEQVLALMGFTGALLPGIPVFFGILQRMGGASGALYFGKASTICIGIGTGVAFGVYLAHVVRFKRG